MNLAAFVLLPTLVATQQAPLTLDLTALQIAHRERLERNVFRAGRLAFLSAAVFDGVTTVVMMLRAEPYCTTVSREHPGGGRSRCGPYHRRGLTSSADHRQEVAAARGLL
jgi:hypothetical protein